jgi:hypothetical protein
MYLFSFGILYYSNIYLKNFINNTPNDEIKNAPRYIDFDIWKKFEYLGWLLLFIYGTFISLGLLSLIKDLI